MVAETELLFHAPLGDGHSPVELVFGDDEPIEQVVVLRAAGRITGLRGAAAIRTLVLASAQGRITGLRGTARGQININVARPTVGQVPSAWQDATAARAVLRSVYEQAAPVLAAVQERGQGAVPISALLLQTWQQAQRRAHATQAAWQDGQRVARMLRQAYEEATRTRAATRQGWQEAQRVGMVSRQQFEEALRRRHSVAQAFGTGVLRGAAVRTDMQDGRAMRIAVLGRYEEAWHPRPGITPPGPKPPIEPPCYVPVVGGPVDLVFVEPWSSSAQLVFVCDKGGPGPEPGETVVVPVKEVYLTVNSAILIRLDNGHLVPAAAMNMSLDVDSWTWQFSAAVPGGALADVQPNSNGDPVVVQATINGVAFRFALERIARERSFGSSQLRVSGRGLAAELDAPYAPEMAFNNPQPRTARQLVEDILTLNGVPIGWTVAAWNLTDWLVPAGVFNHGGSYISAVNAVVGAAGAYVQPHNTDRSLFVHLRYPAPAWEWDSVTPNFELPAAVTSQESFEWVEKPRYNRAFVIGQEHGVHGRYTRSGTAGDLPAPTVVDPLITHADAVRQRGRAILSDTGRIATVTLRLPVLAETGIIKPGNFVRYVEGGNTHIGLSRGVSVDVSMPTIYQTLTLETHVEPV
ncbi:hypothetical protein [Delftia tsuruhatensis]|uniref:hypothetical protein n=1 Tax=Delftia tsuruhatensis TaxID=180282 RepID=UPI0030D08DA7